MFGLNKLFAKESAKKAAMLEALAQFKTGVFPLGITQEWICDFKESKTELELALKLPFAAIGVAEQIADYLSKQLNIKTHVTIEVALPEQAQFKSIKHILLVASGKGGVGKSTTAVNLAYALSEQGAKVGVLDADIYGPSIPSLFGVAHEKPSTADQKTMIPVEKQDIKVQSIGFLVPADDATVWRGPMASQALNQLLNETQWGDLDYLIVDMPPGTGDIQLTMTQKVPASGAVIVTTPQDLALADAHKGIAMFNQVNLPILGLIENMSHFICGECGAKNHVFGQHGGEMLASRHGVPLLAEVPLDVEIRQCSEKGENILLTQSEPKEHYSACAQLLASMMYYQSTAQSSVEIVITDD